MPSTNQQKLVEHLNFLLHNAIISLIEIKDDYQFDLKYDNAIKQYLSTVSKLGICSVIIEIAKMKNHIWLNPF